jgi:hypothetical protein
LKKLLGSEENAFTAVNNSPDILDLDQNKAPKVFGKLPRIITSIFLNYVLYIYTLDVYVKKWGIEKATGVVVRNPNILFIPASGYGSAETAGDETVVLSYIINFTRPIGKPLLLLLFIAVLKQFLAPIILPYLNL